MAATEPKAVTEVAKMDLFEDDDEFEEFEINEGMYVIAPFNKSKFQFQSQLCYFIPRVLN